MRSWPPPLPFPRFPSWVRERERESIYIILNIRLGRKEERGGLLLLSGSCHSFVRVTQIQFATVNFQVPPAMPGKGRFGAMLSCLRCVGQKVTFDQLTDRSIDQVQATFVGLTWMRDIYLCRVSSLSRHDESPTPTFVFAVANFLTSVGDQDQSGKNLADCNKTRKGLQ